MQSQEIFSALRDKEINIADVAEALNVERQSVYSVIRQGNGSERIAKAIAHLIGQPFHTVFPYYAEKEKGKISKKRAKSRDVNLIRQQLSHVI